MSIKPKVLDPYRIVDIVVNQRAHGQFAQGFMTVYDTDMATVLKIIERAFNREGFVHISNQPEPAKGEKKS